MALEIRQAPAESQREAVEGLRRSRGQIGAEEVVGGAPTILSAALEVFTIDRIDVLKGGGLETAKADGWQYLVAPAANRPAGGAAPSPSEVVGVAEKNGVHRFSHRQGGWLAEKTNQAIRIAENLPEVTSGSYELRMLRLPAISNTDALWLKNMQGGDDLIVPVASRIPDLAAGHAYKAAQFLQIVRQAAATPAFDNSPKLSQTNR